MKVMGSGPGSPGPVFVSWARWHRPSSPKQHECAYGSGGHKSKVRFLELKPTCGQGQPPLGAPGENPLPSPTQLLVATCIAGLVAPVSTFKARLTMSTSALTSPSHLYSSLPLPPTLCKVILRPIWITQDNLYLRVFNQIPSSKSLLPYRVPFTGSRGWDLGIFGAIIPPPTS